MLADTFHATITETLSQDYTIVNGPEEDTLRFQVALTDAESSNPLLDTISNVTPFGLIMGQVTGAFALMRQSMGELHLDNQPSIGAVVTLKVPLIGA